jgi:hypothetical protein
MLRRKTGFAILTLLAVAAGLVLFLCLSTPRPTLLVTVSLAIITNDASGTRQATFRLANAGSHAVGVVPVFGLENRSGQWRTNLASPKTITLGTNLMGVLPFHPRLKRLGAGESCDVTLSLPFDDRGWRASFSYIEIRSPLQEARHGLSTLPSRIGLTKKRSVQEGQLTASTDWTDP